MNAPRLQQSQKQVQSLILSPQLRYSLKILQAPAMELCNTIQEELETNPTLEEKTPQGDSLEEVISPASQENSDRNDNSDLRETVDLTKEMEFLSKLDQDSREYFGENSEYNVYTSEDAEKRQHFFDSLVEKPSLQAHLMNQAYLSDASPEIISALPHIIGNLNPSGFLSWIPSDIAQQSKLPLQNIIEAIDLLKSLDPPGIGCANLQTSLLFQLELKNKEDSLTYQIVRDHYDLLLRKRIPEIARFTHSSKENVETALLEIAHLNATPARKFAEDENREIIADVKIFKDQDEWVIVMNNDYIPKLRISDVYKKLLANTETNKKDQKYIKDKINDSKFLINAIDQRQQTIEKIARVLIDKQLNFFEKGVSALQPLTMSQIAEIIGVHETTISRAIANKNVETKWGTFEFKFFFTSGFTNNTGDAIANTSIKKTIKDIIDGEDSHKPLSDQKIVGLMSENGIKIARRTVAKYREEMSIPPTNLRRTYS